MDMAKKTFFIIGCLFLILILNGCKEGILDNEEVPVSNECQKDSDCVPASCCHADSCVPISDKPVCKGVFCTSECAPGTIDCGGGCTCKKGTCEAYYVSI